MNKAIAIIQARMSSSRLPDKVLMDLAGNPMIWHIYKRAESCKFVDKVIIATSTERSDDELAEYCEKKQLNIFRGSLNNVLDRFVKILNQDDYKYFVRITGDCPLIHPNMIDSQIDALNHFDGDIAWAPFIGSLYEGQGVLSVRLLNKVYLCSKDQRDLEHVGSNFIANNPDMFRIVDFKIPDNLIFDGIRITVDEQKDYELMSLIYNNLWKGEIITLNEVLIFLSKNNHLLKINKEIKHKKFNIEVENKKSNWQFSAKVGQYYYKDNLFDLKV